MKNEIRLYMLIFVLCMATVVYGITSIANAASLEHRWKSPSFSGVGTSAHYLTIENQEFTRKEDIKKAKKAEEDRLKSEANNTNYAKFIDNLESRMYAELSKHLSENVFGEACSQSWTQSGSTHVADTVNPAAGEKDGVGTTCSGTYTFNDTTFTYKKDIENDIITLDIAGPDGSTSIELPLNDFRF